jgi:hypothetical protein
MYLIAQCKISVQIIYIWYDEAAKIVSKWTRKTLKELRKKKKSKVTAGVMHKRYLKYHKIFAGKLPGDLEQLIIHAKKSRHMYKKEPATLRYSLQGKDGPWKDNLLAVFKGQKRKNTLTVAQRARANFDLLAKTCKKMDKVDCSAWPNLRVAYILGWCSMCRRLGVIRKIQKYKKGAIRLGKNSALVYEVVSGKRKDSALKNLELDAKAAPAIADMEVARSLEDCGRSMTAAIRTLKEHPAPLLNPGRKSEQDAPYSVKWTVRGAMISHMCAAGCKRMSIKKDDSLLLLTQAFPDQGAYVSRLGKKFKTTKVKQLFKKLKYEDPAEFFSMYLCFYGSPTLDKYDCIKIGKKQVAAAEKYMTASKKKLGLYLTPPEAIREMAVEGVLQ